MYHLFRDVARKDDAIGDGTDNAAMEQLHVRGDFNHLYCDLDSETLRKTVKRFYRAFYFRPRYIWQSLGRIRGTNMLRNAVIGGLNVLNFSTISKET